MKKIYTLCLMAAMALGMQAQVTLVKDINPGTGNSSPAGLFVYNGKIYFAADDANASVDHGKELWVSDGTEAGTYLVKDLNGTPEVPNSGNSTPGNFFILNDQLYFTALTKTWMTDGTEANTNDVLTSGIYFPQSDNSIVYYNNTVASNTLWSYDGITNAAVVNNGTITEKLSGGNLIVFNGKVMLYMEADATIGLELYEYDPATGIYSLIKDITGDDGNSGISNFTVLGDKLYFEALGGLWQTDGTADGTVAITSAASLSGVANLYAWNDLLFLEGDNSSGDQLYVYNPADGTTTNISNISGTNTNHDPSDYCPYNGYLYYRGEDANDTNGHLFRTNGTSIEQLDDVVKDVDEIVVLNGKLYFEGEDASTETTGNELFTFDPATIPTAIGDDAEINPISVYPNPSYGTINVKGLNSERAAYSIYNLTGQCVAKGIVYNNQITFTQKGLYVLQIIDGTQKTVSKITVK
ncbi:T9SS type A sorting domain-containing protein [Carboxylicivirga sp. RSCT41]|uniref:T9SS type A sorting domain-containing protein n=1 Tax=Carboxylicivirga agarovorans TaxID=3417570 RepID=UPI003D3589FE